MLSHSLSGCLKSKASRERRLKESDDEEIQFGFQFYFNQKQFFKNENVATTCYPYIADKVPHNQHSSLSEHPRSVHVNPFCTRASLDVAM